MTSVVSYEGPRIREQLPYDVLQVLRETRDLDPKLTALLVKYAPTQQWYTGDVVMVSGMAFQRSCIFDRWYGANDITNWLTDEQIDGMRPVLVARDAKHVAPQDAA